ncbi:MAG: hypothetical protein OXN25_07505 [Candidatus Poribacteria bacterium]|nr:hypothetical protein [Candidatus Poribacteria bacterium]
MFNRLLSQNRIFTALVLVLVFVASGLLYLNTVKRQADRDLQRTQERLNASKPPPPGETAESGHWHGDEWHTGSHETPAPAGAAVSGGVELPADVETAAPTPLGLSEKQTHPSGVALSEAASEQGTPSDLPRLPPLPPDPESPEELLARNAWHDALIAEHKRVLAMPERTEAELEAYLAAKKALEAKWAAFRAHMDELQRQHEDYMAIMAERRRIRQLHRAQQQQQRAAEAETQGGTQ